MNIKNRTKAEEILFDLARRLCVLIGWREAIGQVYALLYVRAKPLSLDDMAAETNLSKSNVWGIVQQLQSLGAVHKMWATGNRKDLFAAERDFGLIFARGIIPSLERKTAFLDTYLDAAKKELSALQKGMNAEDQSSVEEYVDVLDEIASLKNKLTSLVDVLGALGEAKVK